ncbi:MAG: c-type cytochrome [Terriglobia bacterium]
MALGKQIRAARGAPWRPKEKLMTAFARRQKTEGSGVLSWTVLCLVLLSLLVAGGCRLDMHVEPRYNPESPSTVFADGRSERPMVPGTVARGHLRTDELLYTGQINGKVADLFPFPITKKDLERGRQRFNIYCTPCHDYTGGGEGMIVRRGFPGPPSYHDAKLVNSPVGHFFDVMTNGYGTMYSYATRVSVKDRWRIAAYIRALQLSQNATLSEVPASERLKLLSDKGQ